MSGNSVERAGSSPLRLAMQLLQAPGSRACPQRLIGKEAAACRCAAATSVPSMQMGAMQEAASRMVMRY